MEKATTSIFDTPIPEEELHAKYKRQNNGNMEVYYGLLLAVLSCIFIGISFIIKKISLKRLGFKGHTRAGAGGYGYLKDWLWWLGILSMGIGEGLNFGAYALAPASLVTPLGALSVLVTAVLASKILHERLNLLGKIGCTLCILGSTVIVLHAPKDEDPDTIYGLAERLKSSEFLVYVAVVVITSLILAFIVAPRFGESNVLIYVYICSAIGSLSVSAVKGTGLAIRETISGNNQVTSWLFWFFILFLLVTVSVQINYLNKALDIFSTAVVTPVYYVTFTTMVIIATGILFEEWFTIQFIDIVGSIVGFLIVIIGIFLLNWFKGVNVTMTDLPGLFSPQMHYTTSPLPDEEKLLESVA
ncbi:magnesium transporter NIPA2-like [Artemia franciscana]